MQSREVFKIVKFGNKAGFESKTDKRSGIVSDPNAWSEDQQYIVNLVGRVVRVSVETVRIVDGLAGLPLLGK